MKLILAVFFSLLLPRVGQAITVTTPTHYYITSEYSNALIIIERKTGIEKRLTIGKGLEHPLQINEGYGYLFDNNATTLVQINLETHTPIYFMNMTDKCTPMVIHGSYGFIKHFHTRYITVIELSTFKTEQINVHHFCQCPAPIVVWGDKGYCVYPRGYYVLNLSSSAQEATHIKRDAWLYLCDMKTCKGKGYISDSDKRTIHVIDLKTDNELTEIEVKGRPRNLHLHGHTLFIQCSSIDLFRFINSLAIINTETNELTRTLTGVSSIDHIAIHKDKAFIPLHNDCSLVVVDLSTHQLIKRLSLSLYSPHKVYIHQNVGYVQTKTKVMQFDPEFLILLEDVTRPVGAGTHTLMMLITFSGDHAFLKEPDNQLFFHNLQIKTWATIPSECDNTEDFSVAGRWVYIAGKRVFEIPKSEQKINLINAVFTQPNTDLVCTSLFNNDENVVPEIVGLLEQDEVDLATEILCKALSYYNIYARAFMYFALTYKQFGGEKMTDKYGMLPKQWANHFLTFSDPETISFLMTKCEMK